MPPNHLNRGRRSVAVGGMGPSALRFGTVGILGGGGWALHRDIWWLGTAGILGGLVTKVSFQSGEDNMYFKI